MHKGVDRVPVGVDDWFVPGTVAAGFGLTSRCLHIRAGWGGDSDQREGEEKTSGVCAGDDVPHIHRASVVYVGSFASNL